LFGEQRFGLWASGVVLGYALALAVGLISHQWVSNPAGKPCTDFIWIWLSGKFAASAVPAAIYNHSAFLAAKAALMARPACILGHFDNPPTILFFTYPLGFLPYSVAFAMWIIVTLALYLAALYAIMPRTPAVIAALTPFPVFFNILMGHNGFLSAGLVGLLLALMERRPAPAGILLGLVTYKPQFGILFPFALLASRNWPALSAATAASLTFAAAAAIAFGFETWPSFLGALADRASSLGAAPNQAFTFALVSVFGSLRTAGVSAEISWGVQLMVSTAAVATVCILWARPIPYPLKAAALAVGSLLASPHVHGYDVCILTIGAAFLVKDGLARGFLPRERGTLLACWVGLFLLTGPVPPIISIVLLTLVVRRVMRQPKEVRVAPHPELQLRGQTL
jgi:hypothetical protein